MRAELHSLPAAERAGILHELGLNEASIDKLSASNRGPQELLPRRLHDVGLDAAVLDEQEPTAMRDLTRVCATCPDHRACRHDMEQPDAVARLDGYCPNTHTIEALLREAGTAQAKASR